MGSPTTNRNSVLIAGITPYFLEKGNFWFEENLQQIIQARKTQSFFKNNVLCLETDQKYNPYQLLRELDEIGYEKVLQVSEPGEFSQRGGIIDVFPLNSNNAVRLEFLGNTIDNISQLDIKIEDESTTKLLLKKKLKSQKLFSDLKGLKGGDFLVHLDHGIGIYRQQLAIGNQSYYQLEYGAGDALYVPVGLERKLSRYVGFIKPGISRLGSLAWQKIKKRAKEKAENLARELLDIYAQRTMSLRSPYISDEEIQNQIVGTFQYKETPDQIQAVKDIENDMSKPEPMDRLICGDVGFGKTEIALRAMIKAVASGKQSAMLCPTTILANQHFQNFQDRLKVLPIKISLISRLQTKKEQNHIIQELKDGRVDVVIGTHRLLSDDVAFHNLGLLVVDDEQKFGVKQKEKFKKIRSSLDVLSLSATPIPRTLYLALSSLRNVSLIQTPPEHRLPIKTEISLFNKETIREAIINELKRNGQAYFLYNRVKTIKEARSFLEKLVPEAQFSIIHGRMKEKDLIKVLGDFQNRKTNVLIATTIIENGLDLPNVNTILVADASLLGLSQAHQIRGRIGRSHIQSFAYFFYPSRLNHLAKKRLQALKETEGLGMGYQIALRDLEIRGAGNILGKEQSGNINQIGLNLYCQMLSDAVERLRAVKFTS